MLLLVAEQDVVSGLPRHPEPLPLPPGLQEAAGLPGGFQLRRLEAMCSAHALRRAELAEQLRQRKVCVVKAGCVMQCSGMPALRAWPLLVR